MAKKVKMQAMLSTSVHITDDGMTYNFGSDCSIQNYKKLTSDEQLLSLVEERGDWQLICEIYDASQKCISTGSKVFHHIAMKLTHLLCMRHHDFKTINQLRKSKAMVLRITMLNNRPIDFEFDSVPLREHRALQKRSPF